MSSRQDAFKSLVNAGQIYLDDSIAHHWTNDESLLLVGTKRAPPNTVLGAWPSINAPIIARGTTQLPLRGTGKRLMIKDLENTALVRHDGQEPRTLMVSWQRLQAEGYVRSSRPAPFLGWQVSHGDDPSVILFWTQRVGNGDQRIRLSLPS